MRLGCVKHLNPRQGITIAVFRLMRTSGSQTGCETPKSPPGDYNQDFGDFYAQLQQGVKHLNPRQGITIQYQRSAKYAGLIRDV